MLSLLFNLLVIQMKQPEIELINSNTGQSYGIKPVKSVHWRDGKIVKIIVDFGDGLSMYPESENLFSNYNNLTAKLL